MILPFCNVTKRYTSRKGEVTDPCDNSWLNLLDIVHETLLELIHLSKTLAQAVKFAQFIIFDTPHV